MNNSFEQGRQAYGMLLLWIWKYLSLKDDKVTQFTRPAVWYVTILVTQKYYQLWDSWDLLFCTTSGSTFELAAVPLWWESSNTTACSTSILKAPGERVSTACPAVSLFTARSKREMHRERNITGTHRFGLLHGSKDRASGSGHTRTSCVSPNNCH